MAWVTVLLILGGVSACSITNLVPASLKSLARFYEDGVWTHGGKIPEWYGDNTKSALRDDREIATLANALFAEARYRAQEVNLEGR